MKRVLTLIFGLAPLSLLRKMLFKALGHKISYSSYIGFNIWYTKSIELNSGCRIGSFNLIASDSLHMKPKSFIKRFNYIKGPLAIILNNSSGISNQNKIRRSQAPVTYGSSTLKLGSNSFIVSNHFLDLTKSITIGDNSILAGIGTQLWTHGYYHASIGQNRIRIDGEINIGNNVYVGSSCIFNPGVTVEKSINIGSGSVISKNLTESGMYVNEKLRHLEKNMDSIKNKLVKVENNKSCEQVYLKNE